MSQNEKFRGTSLFAQKPDNCGQFAPFFEFQGIAKPAPERFPALSVEIFCFFNYALLSCERRVRNLPLSRFFHSFFKSNASASRNRSIRTFVLPRVRNRRKPKSVFSLDIHSSRA